MDVFIILLYVVLSFVVIFGVRLAFRRIKEREIGQDPENKITTLREDDMKE